MIREKLQKYIQEKPKAPLNSYHLKLNKKPVLKLEKLTCALFTSTWYKCILNAISML